MDFVNRLAPLSVMAVLCTVSFAQQDVPNDPAKTNPIKVGATVPVVDLVNVDGKATPLKSALGGKPTVLVFYRGSWCPYCNRHLSELMKIEKDLIAAGYQIVAVSPDLPAGLKEATEKNKLDYTLYSDASAAAAKAFGLAFRVDDQTIARYKGFGIDLEVASGQPHHILPVPAVFLVDKNGKVTYAYTNPDYRVRLSGDELLKAAKASS